MSGIDESWNVIRAILRSEFTFYEIKEIVGLAGFDVTALAHLEQRAGGGASKGQLITAIDRGFARIQNKASFISIVVEEMLKRNSLLADELDNYLNRLGLSIAEGKVLPIQLLDTAELAELPEDARQDLAKAVERFRNGDLSGAVSAACASIDSVTSKIYVEKNLGDPGDASFQQKCKKSIEALGVMKKIKSDLENLGWQRTDQFVSNLQGSLNQAAYVMQSLRSGMGDVHGTKPTLKPLVYDSLKWASLILRMLNEKSFA